MKRWSYVGIGVGARVVALVAVALVCALFNTHAQGGLILGTNQLGQRKSINKDGAVEVSLGSSGAPFQGLFFGQEVTSIWLAENGYLSKTDVSGEDYFSDSLADNETPRIANFWDDIFDVSQASGASAEKGIFFSNQPGKYVAATWSQVFLANDFKAGDTVTDYFARSFQTIFFEADTTLANFQFKKDDIAMGFSGLSAGSINATVGIRNDTQFFTIDDVTGRDRGLAPGGLISTNPNNTNSNLNNAHLLPWADDKILLFRPVANEQGQFSRYQVTIETITAIPEPSSCVLFGAGTCLFLWFKTKQQRRRRKNATKSKES